jgi:dTDP-4-dehydrorhamnose 3,5-epimerase
LSDEAEIIYKTTEFYSPKHEHCLKYNDIKINITWPSISSQYLLSPKDAKGQSLT